jgi:hypothetical protein
MVATDQGHTHIVHQLLAASTIEVNATNKVIALTPGYHAGMAPSTTLSSAIVVVVVVVVTFD